METITSSIAFIDEPECIGCTKCIQICPVDSIIGASKMIHTIITHECIGCELCIPVCPVDCITMHPHVNVMNKYDKNITKKRVAARKLRLLATEKTMPTTTTNITIAEKQSYIAQALTRVNNRKAQV